MKCDACLKDIEETGMNLGYSLDLNPGCVQVYPAGKYFICFDCILAGAGVMLSAAKCKENLYPEACEVPVQEVHAVAPDAT